jgi:hypothetical protein
MQYTICTLLNSEKSNENVVHEIRELHLKLNGIFICIGFKPSVRNAKLYFVLSPETYLRSGVKTVRRLHQRVSRTYVKN